jgi:hypothetical protein
MIVDSTFRIDRSKSPHVAILDDASSADANKLMLELGGKALFARVLDTNDGEGGANKQHFDEWKGHDADSATKCRMVELSWQDANVVDTRSGNSFLGRGVLKCPSPLGWMPEPGFRVVRVSWISNVKMRLERVAAKRAFPQPAFNWIAFERSFAEPTQYAVAVYLFWERPIGALDGNALEPTKER